LLQSLVLPVLPTIQHSLHTSRDAVTWVLTAYLLSASVFTPILGRVGDMVGKERMFVVALGALAVGSLLAALAPSIGVMITARAIQGIGGGVFPLAFGIIRDEFPPGKVAGAVGICSATTAVGFGFGMIVAGPIVEALDFHWLFWIPMILALAAAVAAKVAVPQSPVRTRGQINWLAAACLSIWLVALLVAVSEGPTWGWDSTRVIGLVAVSALFVFGWIQVELRSAEPLIDMRMMRIPVVLTANLVAFLFGFGQFVVLVFVPEFVQTPTSAGYGFGASITRSGVFLLPLNVLTFAGSLIAGSLARRIGAKVVLCTGASICVVPFAMLALANGSQWDVYVAMGIFGVGNGLAFSAMSSLIVQGVPVEQTGVASGMNANIRTLGGAIGSGAMASIVTSGAASTGLPREAGYAHGFEMLAGAMLLATIAAFFVPSVRGIRSRGRDLKVATTAT